jgi:hypothetical protein
VGQDSPPASWRSPAGMFGAIDAPRCEFCGRSNHRQARSCGRRDCGGYVDIWLRDNRVRLLENLHSHRGRMVMTTITAPSLPWDERHCRALGAHKHSGALGCRVNRKRALAWNRNAATRLSALHKAAYQRVYRQMGPRACRRLAYVPELQLRGLVHWHVVLAFESPRERKAVRIYVTYLHQLAGGYGYGFVDRKLQAAAAGKVASYVSKYLTKQTGAAGLRELVLRGEAPKRAVYVALSLTSVTRCTMRNLRRRRYIWAVWKVNVSCIEVDVIWRLLAAFPGSTLTPEPARAPAASP